MQTAVFVDAGTNLLLQVSLLLTVEIRFSVIHFNVLSHAVNRITVKDNDAGFWPFGFSVILGGNVTAEDIYRMIFCILRVFQPGFFVRVFFHVFIRIFYMSAKSFELFCKALGVGHVVDFFQAGADIRERRGVF